MGQYGQDIEYHVINFVIAQTSLDKKRLSKQFRLAEDLGLDGDDAIEFMEAFSHDFSVDMSEFSLRDYFGPEAGFNPICYAYWMLFERDKLRSTPITIADLIKAAQNGKWIITRK